VETIYSHDRLVILRLDWIIQSNDSVDNRYTFDENKLTMELHHGWRSIGDGIACAPSNSLSGSIDSDDDHVSNGMQAVLRARRHTGDGMADPGTRDTWADIPVSLLDPTTIVSARPYWIQDVVPYKRKDSRDTDTRCNVLGYSSNLLSRFCVVTNF
jgi:hypothetical protein